MIIWGALAILVAFSAISMGAIGPALFWAAVGSVLIALGISKKQKQKQSQQQTVIVNNYTTLPQESAPVQTAAKSSTSPGMVVRATNSVTTSFDGFSVAGVTFDNDDGSSRQEILRQLCNGKDRGSCEAELETFEYKGSPAVRVMTSAGCVGNIRKADVSEVLDLMAEGPHDISLEINNFVNENGQTIWRGDVYLD